MFVLKNNIEIIPRNFTFFLTVHFVWCIIYTYRLVGWLFDTEKRNEKRKGSVSGAFYLIHLFSLFRAPHSNTRRIDRCKGRAGLTACSFLLQNKEQSPVLRIPFFPNIIPEIEVNFWCQTTCHFIGISGFGVDVPIWLIIQLIGMVCNVKD